MIVFPWLLRIRMNHILCAISKAEREHARIAAGMLGQVGIVWRDAGAARANEASPPHGVEDDGPGNEGLIKPPR